MDSVVDTPVLELETDFFPLFKLFEPFPTPVKPAADLLPLPPFLSLHTPCSIDCLNICRSMVHV